MTKLQIKRAFKSYYLFSIKTQKYRELHEILLYLQCRCAVGASNSYFKIKVPLFLCSLFFKEYLNLYIRINKMVNNSSDSSVTQILQL